MRGRVGDAGTGASLGLDVDLARDSVDNGALYFLFELSKLPAAVGLDDNEEFGLSKLRAAVDLDDNEEFGVEVVDLVASLLGVNIGARPVFDAGVAGAIVVFGNQP